MQPLQLVAHILAVAVVAAHPETENIVTKNLPRTNNAKHVLLDFKTSRMRNAARMADAVYDAPKNIVKGAGKLAKAAGRGVLGAARAAQPRMAVSQ